MDYREYYKRFQMVPEISCIYAIAIYINGKYIILYIGKTKNWQHRTAEHYMSMLCGNGKKYKLLRQLYNECPIFTICLEETSDIDKREAYYINEYMPPLNTQIPDLDNPKKYSRNSIPDCIDDIDCSLIIQPKPNTYYCF